MEDYFRTRFIPPYYVFIYYYPENYRVMMANECVYQIGFPQVQTLNEEDIEGYPEYQENNDDLASNSNSDSSPY